MKVNTGAMLSIRSIGSVILFFSLVESLTLPKAPQQKDYLNVTQKFLENNIRDVATVAFAQFIQEATYEEITGLGEQMVHHRDKCIANVQLPECSQIAIHVMQDKICGVKELSNKYRLSECCTNDTSERRLCFFQRKNVDVSFLTPFQVPDPEKGCQEFEEDQDAFLNHYIYEIARRNPFVFAPTLLSLAAHYKEVSTSCCQEENKHECFHTKVTTITNDLKDISAKQQNLCGVLRQFGPKGVKLLKVVEISQKFPKIDFKELDILLKDVPTMIDGCCEGDVVHCFHSEAKMINYICSKPDSISSKIRDCCQLTAPQRGECIMIHSENDDKPEDLSLGAKIFTEGDDVCQHLHEDKENILTEFLYEYSRQHPELPLTVLLSIGVMYEKLLERCCKTENPKECYGHGEEEFLRVTAETQAITKLECGYFQILGEEGFLNQCLLRLTKKAPQLSPQELISHSQKLAASFTKCCPLGEGQAFACVDNAVRLILGELCGINKNRTINPSVDNCCKSLPAFRSWCFNNLTADETYTPPIFLPEVFTFNITLCQKMEQQRKRRELIVNLVQQKPLSAVEQVMQVLSDFSKMMDCCETEERETCFKEEHSKLYNKIEAVLRS
ncbi:afamin isoform X2 [Trichosurus vulpecula]|uniref:afamin isoform X2 n=1 Tax=Trichosurus vulpecula TaxID=9337 RepID=UPI00186B3642|nr:afamin isoform X2 [Trichosurus vulpecula]